MSMKKNLSVDLGTTFDVSVRVKDETGAAADLTGYTAYFVVYDMEQRRQSQRELRYRPEFRSFYSTTVDAGADGWIKVKVSDEETARWPEGKSAYALDLHAPNGDVERIIYGALDGRSVFDG